MRADRFAYNKDGKNMTLEGLQRCFAASLRTCADRNCEGQHGWTLHPVVSKGDWKHKRKWLQQKRHYMNMAGNAPRAADSGKICPRCLCDGSTPGKHWADMQEGFDNPRDLREAANDSSSKGMIITVQVWLDVCGRCYLLHAVLPFS